MSTVRFLNDGSVETSWLNDDDAPIVWLNDEGAEAGVPSWGCFGPIGFNPLGGDLDPTYTAGLPTPVPVYDSQTITCYLLEVDAESFVSATKAFAAGAFAPIGSTAVGGLYFANSATVTVETLRWATHGLVLEDVEQCVEPRLNPVDVTRRLDFADQGYFKLLSRATIGEVRLTNQDGALDQTAYDFFFEDKPLRLKSRKLNQLSDGRIDGPVNLSEFSLVFSGIAASVRTEQGAMFIEVADILSRLGRTVQRLRYAEQEEGQEQVDAIYQPVALGECFNAPAVLEDPVKLLFRANSLPCLSFRRVKDAGVSLKFNRDVLTRDKLQSLSTEADPNRDPESTGGVIRLGEYATCLKEGLFRLGGQNAGVVTVDVLGGGGQDTEQPWDDATFWTDGTGWIERVAQTSDDLYIEDPIGIARRFLDLYAPPELQASIDSSGWEQLRTSITARSKIYLAPNRDYTFGEILEPLLGSVNVCMISDRSGRIMLRRVVAPATGDGAVDVLITDENSRPGSLKRLPIPYRQPFPTWRGSYAINERPMSDQEIALGVKGSARASLRLPNKIVDAVHPVLRELLPERDPAVIETFLLQRSATIRCLEERLAFYNLDRESFEVEVLGAGYNMEVLNVARVTTERYDLSSGKNFLIVGIEEERNGRSTRFTLFG